MDRALALDVPDNLTDRVLGGSHREKSRWTSENVKLLLPPRQSRGNSQRIRNFKSWRDTGEIRLAPLTVIFGANSAGKSSLGHLLLALKQTALSADRKRALNLGDSSTLIDLGT